MHTYMIFGTYACNEKADVVGVVVGTLSLFLFFLGGVGYSEPRLEMDGGWKRGRGERRRKEWEVAGGLAAGTRHTTQLGDAVRVMRCCFYTTLLVLLCCLAVR